MRQTGEIAAALQEIIGLFGNDAAGAGYRARELLKRYPGQSEALMMLVSARRLTGNIAGLHNLLQSLAKAEPNIASIQYELGLVRAETGDSEGAVSAFSRAVELEPLHAEAWRALGDAHCRTGQKEPAGKAYERYLGLVAETARQPVLHRRRSGTSG